MNTNDYTRSERTTIGRAWAWLEHMAEASGHSESGLLESAYMLDRGSRGCFLTSKVVLMECAWRAMANGWKDADAFDAPGCILARCVGIRLQTRGTSTFQNDHVRFCRAMVDVIEARDAHTARLLAAVK